MIGAQGQNPAVAGIMMRVKTLPCINLYSVQHLLACQSKSFLGFTGGTSRVTNWITGIIGRPSVHMHEQVADFSS